MEQWNKLADDYGLDILAQRYILWPHLTSLLADKFRGSKLLDVGCGNGSYSKFFMSNGVDVTGIDSSESQINLAIANFQGPKYFCAPIQDFDTNLEFNNSFANMVICNIADEKGLDDFFRRIHKISSSNGRLYVTNVAPDYQISCQTRPLIHDYPDSIYEGVSFSISLRKTNDELIGPFTNYHWSESKLISVAKTNNWKIKTSSELVPLVEDANDWPKYILYEFEKVR